MVQLGFDRFLNLRFIRVRFIYYAAQYENLMGENENVNSSAW